MSKNNAKLTDLNLLYSLGIDPKTGLPLKMGSSECELKRDIKKNLRIKDEATALNRFKWYNLPKGLNARLMERILYYKGQGIMFYLGDSFYFLPYALSGSIDVYGRYTGVTPLPFNGTVGEGKKESPWIQGLNFKPLYDILDKEEFAKLSEEDFRDKIKNSCVIFKDYSEQISQTNISRQVLNDPVLDVMADCVPFMRTALLNSTGIQGMRVQNENEQSNVYAASNAMNKAALTGQKYIPIIGQVEFQEMTSGNVAKAEEFLLAYQSLDNFRLGLYGLENAGMFQKKAHMLQDEQDMNTNSMSLIMRDSLEYRQDACTIANSLWGLDMWVEVAETAYEDNSILDDESEEVIDVEDNDENDGGEDE